MTEQTQEREPRVITGEVRDFAHSLITPPSVERIIRAHLPRRMPIEQVLSELQGVIVDNPALKKCTPRSLIRSIAKGLLLNLELGRTWHLVPFDVKVVEEDGSTRHETRAKMLIDYKGKVILMQRDVDGDGVRRVLRVDYDVVWSNEKYQSVGGSEPFIRHDKILSSRHRGDPVGGYAFAEFRPIKLEDGSWYRAFVAAELDDVETNHTRQKYSKLWKSQPLKELGWYIEKTCVHQLAKKVPLDDMRLMLAGDEDASEIVTSRDDAEADAELEARTIKLERPVAINSPREKNLLGAGPVPMVNVSVARDPIAVMQEAL
jgi:recombinational DNA repair protein RecT